LQKGVCGALIPEENLPFTKDGLKPDIIINPHAFPSRMTIGHLFESVLAKYGAMKGTFMDATPFNHNDYEPMFDMLEKDFGMERYGNEMMYNGFTGEQIATEIFIGPTFYQKLKHMVLDKNNYRSTGPKTLRTRQPVHGRSNGLQKHIVLVTIIVYGSNITKLLEHPKTQDTTMVKILEMIEKS